MRQLLSLQESLSEHLKDGFLRGKADVVGPLWPFIAEPRPLPARKHDHSHLALADPGLTESAKLRLLSRRQLGAIADQLWLDRLQRLRFLGSPVTCIFLIDDQVSVELIDLLRVDLRCILKELLLLSCVQLVEVVENVTLIRQIELPTEGRVGFVENQSRLVLGKLLAVSTAASVTHLYLIICLNY